MIAAFLLVFIDTLNNFAETFIIMIYYQVTMFEDKRDMAEGLPRHGRIKGVKWLEFNGDDKGMLVGEEKDDESLAIQILMQNLEKVESELVGTNDPSQKHLIGTKKRYVKNESDLVDLLHGNYETVLVKKYTSQL